jgi:prepilin-type N-terminal cleavage/methylation domain-containing protein
MKKAFTLVELAIVIVIIGLLVGGVLVGQELITQAQINSIVKGYQSYESSLIVFKDKYNCIAGDCNKAQTYFGASNTQNGNGNRHIAENTNESPLVWQHLALAKLIKGSYNGSITGGVQPNVNVPSISMAGGAIVVRASVVWGKHGNFMEIGKANTDPAQFYANRPITTPVEAQQIDRKLDDGIANNGKFICYDSWAVCSATWASTGTGADYNMSVTDKTCTCMFLTAGVD